MIQSRDYNPSRSVSPSNALDVVFDGVGPSNTLILVTLYSMVWDHRIP